MRKMFSPKMLAVGSAVVAALTAATNVFAVDLVTLPNTNDIFTGVTAYSAGTFTAFVFFAYLIIGIAVGAMVVTLIIRLVKGAAKRVLGGGKRGRGRRGRR